MLTAPRTAARHPNSNRSSAFLAARVRLHSTLDQFDHRDTLVEGQCTHTLVELGTDLPIELPSLGASMGQPAAVGGGQGPRLASSPAGQSGRGIALGELGQDQHVLAFEVGHHATFSASSLLTAAHSASISVRAASPFSISGPDLPTVAAAA